MQLKREEKESTHTYLTKEHLRYLKYLYKRNSIASIPLHLSFLSNSISILKLIFALYTRLDLTKKIHYRHSILISISIPDRYDTIYFFDPVAISYEAESANGDMCSVVFFLCVTDWHIQINL